MADPVRLTGLDGTIALGSSAYTGADCTDCDLTVTQSVIEGAAKADLFEVRQVQRKSASGTIGKLVTTIGMVKSAMMGATLKLTLTADDGKAVFDGNVIVTQVGWTSPDGYQTENLSWVSSGEFTLGEGAGGD